MTTSATSNLQLGNVLLGKYRVERVLGRGGMGVVIAARHLQLGEVYAIKIMLPEMVESPEAVERFLREARASARLRGEHVARVHDVGTLDDGVPFMVLELLEGSDLDHWLTTRGRLSVGDAAAYVHQACQALAEAHGLGIVHRDLKPANLFLTRKADGTPCIKVLDFGISKDMAGADQVNAKLTKTGAIMGSPHYMSPEQLVDGKNVDARCDIWALGILLYELVTGTTPFHAESLPEVIAKVLSVVPPPPSQVRPEISTNFDMLVQRCMDRNRDTRFQSVQEVMQALTPFINPSDLQKITAIRPPSMPEIQGALAQSAVGWGQATVGSNALTVVQRAPGFSRRIVGITAIAGVLLGIGLVAFVVTRPTEPKSETGTNSVPSAATSEKTVEPAAPTVTTTNAEAPAPVQSATTPVKQTLPVSTIKTPTPVVSTTTKTKSKVKGFDE